MRIVLSIKPEFANKIFDGTKKYEFRKSIFKSDKVKTVVVYASSPVKRVIGEFDIEKVINDDLDALWSKTHLQSGISIEYFYSYFENRTTGYAIKISKVRKYKKSKCLLKDYNLMPPQSFAYLH